MFDSDPVENTLARDKGFISHLESFEPFGIRDYLVDGQEVHAADDGLTFGAECEADEVIGRGAQ